MIDLEKQQQKLHDEAEVVLNNLKLVELLSKIGKVKFHGSFITGLMTWPDIDIHVESNITDVEYMELVQKLFTKNDYVKSLHIADYRKNQNPDYPNGIYLGLKCRGMLFKEWKIDIWFVKKDTGNIYDDWIINNIDLDKRSLILFIKNSVHSNPKYKKEILSVDIYDAVIKNEVKSLEEFKTYLNEKGKSL